MNKDTKKLKEGEQTKTECNQDNIYSLYKKENTNTDGIIC